MGEYSRSHGSKRNARPVCFSDPDVYDSRRSKCRQCDWKRPCRSLVLRKVDREREAEEEEEEEEAELGEDGRQHKRPEDFTERTDNGGVSFAGALTANAAMYALGVVLGEMRYAVDQVPRFAYPDPFAEAIQRGRKRAGEED